MPLEGQCFLAHERIVKLGGLIVVIQQLFALHHIDLQVERTVRQRILDWNCDFSRLLESCCVLGGCELIPQLDVSLCLFEQFFVIRLQVNLFLNDLVLIFLLGEVKLIFAFR